MMLAPKKKGTPPSTKPKVEKEKPDKPKAGSGESGSKTARKRGNK